MENREHYVLSEKDVTPYTYDAVGNLLAEADAQNNITRYYIYGLGLMAMVTPTDQVYCYNFNAVGSTVAMTDSSQNMVNKYAYDPFGNVANQVEAVTQPFKFVGQFGVMTEPNGFYYMRARYYDPSVGRFISEDPIGFDGGDVNLMVYVQNNPVNLIDPSGALPAIAIPILVGAGVGAISGASGAIAQGGGTTDILVAAGIGALKGAAVGALGPTTRIASMVVNGLLGASSNIAGQAITNYLHDASVGDINVGSVIGSATGSAIGGGIIGSSMVNNALALPASTANPYLPYLLGSMGMTSTALGPAIGGTFCKGK